ncbi:hypothetical protein [Streptomyces sp. CB03238]|uniref:hypothetical protein n=1 Tax=Streptomyces sp. CB03238 TaxID=1907777 RepID=UPI000A12150A|nr:hypothetical protein [Streptomyces sp. CB03238]ORT61950.1 hypothetical protein BKD26_00295 [Streptomyces sp. CB03238]
MHPDIHLHLHELRAAELRGRAPRRPAPRRRTARPLFRTRLGWTLVELGLRLVAAPPPHTARIA